MIGSYYSYTAQIRDRDAKFMTFIAEQDKNFVYVP